MVAQACTNSAITPQRLQDFSRLMQEKLDRGDTQAKKAYLGSVIARIEVGDDKVRIISEKASSAAVIAGNPPETACSRFLYTNGAPVRMKVRTLMLLKFHYDPTAEWRDITDRCFHIENFHAASHLGAREEVMEAFPRFGLGKTRILDARS